jgi:Fungal specific transcription factor domain
MRDILDASSSEDEAYPSPDQSGSSLANYGPNHQGFIFGYSSTMNSLRNLHPSPAQMFILWEAYKENVDPVVKIFHRPTVGKMLSDASNDLTKISKPAEVLFFAIYYGATVSLSPQQCQTLFGEPKVSMLNRYRFAVEQALTRANFLSTASLMTLQAFVFFLVCVRHQDHSRIVWSLSGLAIHLAQALGIHRDGSAFSLTPFETEMRRRLWWHISILDTRSAEDHSTDPSFSEQSYDTRLPLNINDDEISPSSKEIPPEHVGTTEMTFCLIRFELSVTTRRLNFVPPGGTPCLSELATRTIDEKNNIIEVCHHRIEERYLLHCDISVPIYWVCATVARLIMAKMWLMANHPSRYTTTSPGQVKLPSSEIQERFFLTSVDVIEFSRLLMTNENTAKWSWLFNLYMQWHPVTYILTELCRRKPDADYARGWRAVDMVWNAEEARKIHRSSLWRPLRQLYEKARAIRETYLREAQQVPTTTNETSIEPCEWQDIKFGHGRNLGVVTSTAAALGLDLDDAEMERGEIAGMMDEELPDDGAQAIPADNSDGVAAEDAYPQSTQPPNALPSFFSNFDVDPLAEFSLYAFPPTSRDLQTSLPQSQIRPSNLTDEETINQWLSQGDIAYQQGAGINNWRDNGSWGPTAR